MRTEAKNKAGAPHINNGGDDTIPQPLMLADRPRRNLSRRRLLHRHGQTEQSMPTPQELETKSGKR